MARTIGNITYFSAN